MVISILVTSVTSLVSATALGGRIHLACSEARAPSKSLIYKANEGASAPSFICVALSVNLVYSYLTLLRRRYGARYL
jgi:hypothetical protein